MESQVAWLGLVIAFFSLVVSVVAIVLPLVRERQKERELEEVRVSVELMPELEKSERQYSYKRIGGNEAGLFEAVVHVVNQGKSPLYVRDVRMVFLHNGVEVAEFPFVATIPVDGAFAPKQGCYYVLALSKDVLAYSNEYGSMSPSKDHDYRIVVRDHSGEVWSGRPQINFSEASIWAYYAEERASKSNDGTDAPGG